MRRNVTSAGVGEKRQAEGTNTIVSADAVETEEQVFEYPEEGEGDCEQLVVVGICKEGRGRDQGSSESRGRRR